MSFNTATGSRPRLIVMTTLLVMAIARPILAQPAETSSKVNMQGNSFTKRTFTFWNSCLGVDGQIDVPVMGRIPISENISAIPTDRVYFDYRGFSNALNATIADGAGTTLGNRDFSVARYTLGFEKTFLNGRGSVEIRTPLIGTVGNSFDQGVANQSGGVGNLSIISKVLLFESDTMAIATGLGISAPTGQDTQITLDDELFTLRNETAHLAPFVGFLATPNNRTVFQGFLTFDIPAGGNSIEFRDTSVGGSPYNLGELRDQRLVYVDFAAAYWLYRNPESRGITGLASAVEFHYTTGFKNADTLFGSTYCTDFSWGNAPNGFIAQNRIDVMNLTVGLHTTFGNRTTFYAGAVFPLDQGMDRLFDSEIQASVNFRF